MKDSPAHFPPATAFFFVPCIWPLALHSPLQRFRVCPDCYVKNTCNRKISALSDGGGILTSEILMDIVTFEIKSRKSSSWLMAKIMSFLCAFPWKLVNVFKRSHTKPCLPFFLAILEKSHVCFFILILKFTLGILFI